MNDKLEKKIIIQICCVKGSHVKLVKCVYIFYIFVIIMIMHHSANLTSAHLSFITNQGMFTYIAKMHNR